MTRIEIELTDEQVAALRKDFQNSDPDAYWLLSMAHAALPPEPIRLEIELDPDLFDWISKPGAYGSGMQIGPCGAGVLNAVLAAAIAKRENEAREATS